MEEIACRMCCETLDIWEDDIVVISRLVPKSKMTSEDGLMYFHSDCYCGIAGEAYTPGKVDWNEK